jgi:hypothetical protein
VRNEPERQRRQQVDQEMAQEVTGPVRRKRQLEREFEQENRADRQVGPGKEQVLPSREPARARALEDSLGRDQNEQHQDQEQHRVFENRNEPPAEEFLHSQVEQLFRPLALHLAARAADSPRLRAQMLARIVLALVARRSHPFSHLRGTLTLARGLVSCGAGHRAR